MNTISHELLENFAVCNNLDMKLCWPQLSR